MTWAIRTISTGNLRMEIRIMRKHLIGTILVLAALTACNKEVETPVVDNGQEEATPGKVTLTFTAAISEETRTAYAGDKTASWTTGDKISVCLMKNTDYEVVDFTFDGSVFSAEVEPGYNYTIVSGVYPANDVYSSSSNLYFEDGAVKSVYLPNSYDLEDADDTGRFIPLIGSFDGGSMTFSHFCSAMKVTLTNVPADATVFTFTTNGKQIAGDFTLSDGGRMTMANQTSNNSVQFTFETGQTERSFYIPIPDGQLTAGSYVTVEKTIENSNNEVLFKKVINSTPTFPRTSDNKDAIRILPEVACWTKKDNWCATYLREELNSSTHNVNSIVEVAIPENTKYQYYMYDASTFDEEYDSFADYFISSQFVTDRGARTTYSQPRTIKYQKKTPGNYYFLIYGVDANKNFTGEYNIIIITIPEFITPEGWSISVDENYSNEGTIITVGKIKVPQGKSWQFSYTSKENFINSYGADPAVFIWSRRKDSSTLYTTTSRTINMNSVRGEYVLLIYGMNERVSSDEDRIPTFEYYMLEYSFEEPTLDYLSWIGTWTVTDSKSTPNVDTWTISRIQANHTYSVSGMNGNLFTAVANYDATNNRIVFQSQFVGTSNTSDFYLFGSSTTAGNAVRQTEEPYDLMYIEQSASGIVLNGFTLPDNTVCARYYRINYNRNTSAWTYTNARYIPSILTPAE